MPEATSLQDLLRIRDFPKNRRFFHRLPGCLGTAVGYRYEEGARRFAEKDGKRIPAILVFVEEKIPFASLDRKWVIPERFSGPDGLECASDVMVGSAPDRPMATQPLTGANARLHRDLHEKNLGVIGGIPIDAPATTGTAGCVVRFTPERAPRARGAHADLGVLTNYHVAGFEGTRMIKGGGRISVLGSTRRSIAFASRTKRTTDLESYLHEARHRVDIGLVALEKSAADRVSAGVYGIRPLGRPYQLDLGTMGPIGERVVGVGQALGRQEGRIMAYGYSWRNDVSSASWCATDYLILSTTGQPFAAPGDSGKIVVSDDEKRQPIALLWGGERHDFWNVQAQASCAYATDIELVLDLLDAEIF